MNKMIKIKIIKHARSTKPKDMKGVLETPKDGSKHGNIPTPKGSKIIVLDQIQSLKTTTETRNPISTIDKIMDTISSLSAIWARQWEGKDKGKGDDSTVELPKKNAPKEKL